MATTFEDTDCQGNLSCNNLVVRGSLTVDGETVGGPPFVPPYPSVTPQVDQIFVRQFGDDVTGNGTIVSPFRTVQNAVRYAASLEPNGHATLIECTGIGLEIFPAGFDFPQIQSTVEGWTFGDPSTLPFLALGALTIRALPQALSAIPLAEATIDPSDIVSIVADPSTELATITVATPRASWAADGLATLDAGLIGTGVNATGNAMCMVFGSDATHIRVANTTDALVTSPQQGFLLAEQSAHFRSLGAGNDGGGILIENMSSVVIQGIRFDVIGGGSSLVIAKAIQPFMEFCNVDGLGSFACTLQHGVFSSLIKGSLDLEGTNISTRRSRIRDVSSIFYFGGGPQTFRQTVFQRCDAIGASTFAAVDGGLDATGWEFKDALIEFGTSPVAGIFARGGSLWSLENVTIANCAGDAIRSVGSPMVLATVTGSGNGGLGIAGDDGAQIRIADAATNVTGVGGDLQSGTLAVRSYADFRASVPICNQWDITTPFVTNTAGKM